jgi:hypothetical protein
MAKKAKELAALAVSRLKEQGDSQSAALTACTFGSSAAAGQMDKLPLLP